MLLLGSTGLTAATGEQAVPAPSERDPQGWTDLLAKAGPKLEGWVRGPLPARPSSVPSRSGLSTRRPDIWFARGTAAMSGFAGTRSWATSSTTSNGDSRRLPGKKGYNSGIYARNSADARIYHQAQTGDGSGGYLFGTTENKGAPKRFNLSKQQPASRVKPAGEWNTFEITCRGPEMALWVNGGVANQWHDCEVKRGYVGLEAEGWRIEFRNVKIKSLDGTKPAKTESKG